MILITNDDGVQSDGIFHLVEAVRDLDEVVVVAPERERSAVSHALTLHKPLRLKEVEFRGRDVKAYMVNGTPADCVVLGIYRACREKPSLILSGINHGPNMGSDLYYSGTLAAAVEGSLAGVSSIAFSMDAFSSLWWESAAQIAFIVTKGAIKNNLEPEVVLNVNIPNLPFEGIKGVRYTVQGRWWYKNQLEERVDPRKETYFWLSNHLEHVLGDRESDVEAVRNGYVSITPLDYSLTRKDYLPKLISWGLSLRG